MHDGNNTTNLENQYIERFILFFFIIATLPDQEKMFTA